MRRKEKVHVEIGLVSDIMISVLKNCVIVLLVCVIVFVNAVDYGHPKIRHLHLVEKYPYYWPYDRPELEDIQDHGGFCTLQFDSDSPCYYAVRFIINDTLATGDVICVHSDLTDCDCLVVGKRNCEGPIVMFDSYDKAVVFVKGFHEEDSEEQSSFYFRMWYEELGP